MQKRGRGRPPIDKEARAAELQRRLDAGENPDDVRMFQSTLSLATMKQIDKLAVKLYGTSVDKRTSTINHIMRNIMDIITDPAVEQRIDSDFLFRNDPIHFIRKCVADALEADSDKPTDFQLL